MCLNLIVTFNLIKIYFLLHSSAHKQLIKSIYPIWKDEIFRVLQSDENPFANDGLHRRRHDHRRHADHEIESIIMGVVIGKTQTTLLVSS